MKKYRSTGESNTAGYLILNDVKFDYEPLWLQYKIPESLHKYLPDFRLAYAGRTYNKNSDIHDYMWLEYKGVGPRDGLIKDCKIKMLCIREQYPKLDLRFVFHNANAITGNGRGKVKVTYGEWATIHGFKWCHKRIPESWLKELGYK